MLKRGFLDLNSVTLKVGDQVRVTQKDLADDGQMRRRVYEAIYCGFHQLSSYTTPYLILMEGRTARYINPHEIIEMEYQFEPPDLSIRALPERVEGEWVDQDC